MQVSHLLYRRKSSVRILSAELLKIPLQSRGCSGVFASYRIGRHGLNFRFQRLTQQKTQLTVPEYDGMGQQNYSSKTASRLHSRLAVINESAFENP